MCGHILISPLFPFVVPIDGPRKPRYFYLPIYRVRAYFLFNRSWSLHRNFLFGGPPAFFPPFGLCYNFFRLPSFSRLSFGIFHLDFPPPPLRRAEFPENPLSPMHHTHLLYSSTITSYRSLFFPLKRRSVFRPGMIINLMVLPGERCWTPLPNPLHTFRDDPHVLPELSMSLCLPAVNIVCTIQRGYRSLLSLQSLHPSRKPPHETFIVIKPLDFVCPPPPKTPFIKMSFSRVKRARISSTFL